jgi:putative NAD(P)H nitroreductase
MTLMYAAQDAGYATGPMIGFDPAAVGNLVGLDEHHIPVMLVVIGQQTGDIRPRPKRLPIEEVVKLESLVGDGLQ